MIDIYWYLTSWQEHVLRGLDYLRNTGIKPDSRVREAIRVVIARRHQNRRWPLNFRHPEYIPLKMETNVGGQAAGTHCALSEFCIGTTTRRVSCVPAWTRIPKGCCC